jgi:hypothetical protein
MPNECERVSDTIRFLSAIVLMELRFGADTSRRKEAVEAFGVRSPLERQNEMKGQHTLSI